MGVFSSCTIFVPSSPIEGREISWPQRQAQLLRIQSWNMQSAMSIRQPQQAAIVYFAWQQQGKNYQQQISGPLNISAARIVAIPGKVTLFQGNQPPITDTTPEKLLQSALGIRLPVSHLYYWIRGLPVPRVGIQQRQFDNAHHIVFLKQQGWTVQYVSFIHVNGIDLPNKMVLDYPGLEVKLVIKAWNLL